MAYWRFQYHVSNLTEILKKKQEAEENQNDKVHVNSSETMKNSQAQMNKYTKAPQLSGASMPKFPSMPKIKL